MPRSLHPARGALLALAPSAIAPDRRPARMTRKGRHDYPWFVWLALGVDPLTAAVLLAVERPRLDKSHPTERREERS
jgi:hypothetical protein